MIQVPEQQAVYVKGRFHRSVQLTKDWQSRADLSSYLVTPTVRDLANRIVGELAPPGGIRAWSITGPYGTGKSSFALFLSRLLAQETEGLRTEALTNVAEGKPLLPVLLVGQRAPLNRSLLEALSAAVAPLEPDLASGLEADLTAPRRLTDERVVQHFETVAGSVHKLGYGGLVVVLDEFGKFLEYGAQHAEDLLIMQSLAEAATRSSVPWVLLTILHTGFAEYLDAFDEVRRAEWQKVQGRFTDVAFQEPPEQLLKLLGSALETNFPAAIAQAYNQEIAACANDDALAEARSRLSLAELLPACAPLHPLCALLLWPLFRGKLAQNERSLFSFLTSHEPFGLQAFLQRHTFTEETIPTPFYRLEQLYDYVKISLGAGLYRGEAGRRWAELEDALYRIGAAAPLEATAVLKTLGLLWLYGAPIGLRATEETIALAVGDKEKVKRVLSYLEHASIIVFRRFEGAYGLWEGSDVDLDKQFYEARQQIGQGNLAQRLERAIELRPFVARAHYIQTGTLRFFTVEVVSSSETTLEDILSQTEREGDGRVVYVLSPSVQTGRTEAVRQALIAEAETLTSELDETAKPIVFAFPQPLVGLEEALTEVECWRYVQDNTPSLQGDRVAKRELAVRLEHAEQRLEALAGSVFSLRGYRFAVDALTWVYRGQQHNLADARAFSSWLSGLCREVYHGAAPLHNELLNREQLSSAAKAALNRLTKAVVASSNEPRFGIVGTPAEASMYASLFQEGGFHREVAPGHWKLETPEPSWRGVWDAIETFLESTKLGRKPLLELYGTLKRPPYGLREGPLPLLICTMLLIKKDDVVLYYNGLFQPELYEETLELLVRIPESFELQQVDLSGDSKAVLEAVEQTLESLSLYSSGDGSPLLRLVKPLVLTLAKLPTYSKNTTRLEPPEAAQFRNVILKAKDPHTLLLEDIPKILRLDAQQEREAFTEKLRRCIWALQRAYPDLLDTLEQHLTHIFDLQGTTDQTRRESLRARALPLKGFASDPALVLLINEASRDDAHDWREAIGRAVLKGKPPTTWNDADLVAFQVNLTRLASDFVRLEELVAEKHATGAEQIIRVGILGQQVHEMRQTIALHADRAEDVKNLSDRLMVTLQEYSSDANGDRVKLAALAHAVAHYLGGERPEHDDT